MKYFKKLIGSLDNSSQKNRLLILAYKYNKFAEAENLAGEKIPIDTWEMESLIDPSGYEIIRPELERIITDVPSDD